MSATLIHKTHFAPGEYTGGLRATNFPSTSATTTRSHLAILLATSLLFFLYGIHQGDLYRTEGLRAIIAKNMLHTGDWIVPRLYNEPILTKPPMLYWAIAGLGKLTGDVHVWTSRLPAALAGMISLFIVYFTVRRYVNNTPKGDSQEGETWEGKAPAEPSAIPRPHPKHPHEAPASWLPLLAALALPMSMMWLEKASSAEIDTLLVMWVLAAWACFLRILECTTQNSALRTQHSGLIFWWIATLICVAAGVLTKWNAFLFFYIMAIPTLVYYRQLWRLFHWHHLLACTLGVALVFAWLGPVILELGWSNVISMLWKEGAPRILPSENTSKHLWLETLAHPFKVLAISFPWSILALWSVVITLRRDDAACNNSHTFSKNNPAGSRSETAGLSQSPLTITLASWVIAGTLMMTAFPDHNIRQSFPLVPAWTLLGVLALARLLHALPLTKLHRYAALALLLWCIIKIAYVEILVPARFHKRPDLQTQAHIINSHVPPGQTLYLSKVKDECLLFHVSNHLQRLPSADQTPANSWLLLTEKERAAFPLPLTHEHHLQDAQGDPLVLVCTR